MEPLPTTITGVEALRRRLCNIRTMNEEVAHEIDPEMVLTRFQEFAEHNLKQVMHLAELDIFYHWLLSRESCLILAQADDVRTVNGHSISATSGFCVTLARSLQQLAPRCQSPTVVLHFFCGMHTGMRNGLAGPYGLVRCLINQLLLATADQPWPTENELQEELALYDIQGRELEGACKIFTNLLLRENPDKTVFCVIDGIQAFERSKTAGRFEEMLKVVSYLDACVTYSRCPVKFLLLSIKEATPQMREYIREGSLVTLWPWDNWPLAVTQQAMIGTFQIIAESLTIPQGVSGDAP